MILGVAVLVRMISFSSLGSHCAAVAEPSVITRQCDRPRELAVGMMTSNATRLMAFMAQTTWARQLRDVYVFSEVPDSILHTEVISPLSEMESVQHDRSDGGWKDFAMLKRLYELAPDKDWYMIIDDDSYVVVPTFLCILRTALKRGGMVYAGLGFQTDVAQQGFDGFDDVGFAVGGPGFVLSRRLVLLLLPLLESCSARYQNHSGLGDVRMGLCIHQVTKLLKQEDFIKHTVSVTTFPGLSNLNVSEQLGVARITGTYKPQDNRAADSMQERRSLQAEQKAELVLGRTG